MGNFNYQDKKFMNLALELAKSGLGNTSPNPAVGAVIVKNNRIVGQGYHKKAGGPHAEIFALRQARGKTKGATLYVTLEPCSHFGKTPPCTKEIIESRIKNIFVSMVDPNPLNNGRGIRELRNKGIKVKVGLLRDEAEKLNEAFIKLVTKKTPLVTVKIAQSLDGKIATYTGNSKWISGAKSRNYVQRLRAQNDAIMVGINTVLKDNPRLTYRGPILRKNRPIKIVLDPYLKIPLEAKILSESLTIPTIIATSRKAPLTKVKILEDMGIIVMKIEGKNSLISLKSLMKKLAQLEITSLLIEGGGETIASAFQEKIVDKVLFFLAPKIIGGRTAITSCEGEGIDRINKAIKLEKMEVKRIGQDLLIEAQVK